MTSGRQSLFTGLRHFYHSWICTAFGFSNNPVEYGMINPLSTPTKEFIRTHLQADPKSLALQAAKYPEVEMRDAITQIAGHQIAVVKIPSWAAIEEIRYPHHLSMEQCSSEATARYKAGWVQGDSLTDLTGGFGVDCAFMGAEFKHYCPDLHLFRHH